MARVKLAAFGEILIRKRTGEYPHPFHGRFTSREQTALSIRYEQFSWADRRSSSARPRQWLGFPDTPVIIASMH
jgi:hypothetical protein